MSHRYVSRHKGRCESPRPGATQYPLACVRDPAVGAVADHVEVGPGRGDVLLAFAAARPDVNFFAIEHANGEVLVIPMIETREGIDKIDEILSVPGISGIYIGPSDMGLSLGMIPILDREEPVILEIYDKLVASCRKHGKFAGLGEKFRGGLIMRVRADLDQHRFEAERGEDVAVGRVAGGGERDPITRFKRGKKRQLKRRR